MNDSKKKYVLVNGGKELGYEADSLEELLRSMRFSANENEEGLSDCFVGMADVYGAEEWSRLVENYHFEKMASGHESALFTNYAKSWLSSTDMPRTPEPHQCVVRILGDYHKHLLFDGEPTLGVVNWTLKDCFDDESYEILARDTDAEGPASVVETSKPVVFGKRWRLEREGERTGFEADTILDLLKAIAGRKNDSQQPGCEDFYGFARVVDDPEEWERIVERNARMGAHEFSWLDDRDLACEKAMWQWLDERGYPRHLQLDQALVRFGISACALGYATLISASSDDPAPVNKALARWIPEPAYRIVENR